MSSGLDVPRLTDNVILAAFPAEALGRLATRAQYVELAAGEGVHRAGDEHQVAYFPVRGLFSVMAVMPDGQSVEVAGVGRYGVLGLARLLGVPSSPFEMVAKGPTAAYRVPVEELVWTMNRWPEVAALILRYVHFRVVALAFGSACHRLHTLEQRAARWLLETSDELDSHVVPTTHEFMAELLGVQRPRLSETIQRLRTNGIETPGRGVVAIVNREVLERAACACYEIIRSHSTRRHSDGW